MELSSFCSTHVNNEDHLPPLLQTPAVRPGFHCELLALGSALEGTDQFEPLTPDPALSTQG